MNLYSFALLCFAFGVLLVSVLVIMKRKDYIAIRFLLFSIGVSGWGFLTSLWMTQNYSENITLWLIRLSNFFAIFIPITWTHFIFEFINKEEPIKGFYLANYSIAIFLALFSFSPIFIEKVHPILDFKYYTGAGPLYLLFMIIFYILVPYTFYFLVRSYQRSEGQTREQLKYLVLGTSVGFTAGGLTFLPIYLIPVPQFFLSLMPLYPLLTGIALIRHGLFDTQQVLDALRRDKLAAIGTLATSINHEIHNPLYIIKGLAESHLANFEEGVYSNYEHALHKANEIFEKTVTQASRAMDIMKRFAMFAKQDVNQDPKIEVVNLIQVLADVLPLVNHELELDKIELIQNVPPALPPMKVDRRHLEEILFNLIVNACQAFKNAPPRHPDPGHSKGEGSQSFIQKDRIEITATQQNGHVNILVKDNGSGIPADRLKQIFEPFYTTKDEGTGLGLYVTKQLVEKNHGKISVKSKVGEGTVFTLEFKQ